MNYPPIYALAKASSEVRGFLYGPNGPLRFYLFGEADQTTIKPYAVWQTVGGSPENYINQVPDADSWITQVDVYAADPNGATKSRDIATALMNAFEPVAHVTSYNGEYKEFETKLFRFSFTVEWWSLRP